MPKPGPAARIHGIRPLDRRRTRWPVNGCKASAGGVLGRPRIADTRAPCVLACLAFRHHRPGADTARGVLPTPARVKILGPPSVTATVCSKWAEREPSSVEIDQRSSATTTEAVPALIIGSIARVIPGASSGPLPGSPKFGIWG